MAIGALGSEKSLCCPLLLESFGGAVAKTRYNLVGKWPKQGASWKGKQLRRGSEVLLDYVGNFLLLGLPESVKNVRCRGVAAASPLFSNLELCKQTPADLQLDQRYPDGWSNVLQGSCFDQSCRGSIRPQLCVVPRCTLFWSLSIQDGVPCFGHSTFCSWSSNSPYYFQVMLHQTVFAKKENACHVLTAENSKQSSSWKFKWAGHTRRLKTRHRRCLSLS